MNKRLPAVALVLLGGWMPLPAGHAPGDTLVRVQQSNDFNWQPPVYDLGSVGTPATPVTPVIDTPTVVTRPPPPTEEERITLIPRAIVSAGGEEVTSLSFSPSIYGLVDGWLNTRWLDWKGVPYEIEMQARQVYNCVVVGASAGCASITRLAPAVKIKRSDYDAAVASISPYVYADIWGPYDGGWTVLPPGDDSAFVNALRASMGAGSVFPTRRVGRYARQWCPNSNCIALALPK